MKKVTKFKGLAFALLLMGTLASCKDKETTVDETTTTETTTMDVDTTAMPPTTPEEMPADTTTTGEPAGTHPN